MKRLLFTAAASVLNLSLNGCGEPRYPASEVMLDEAPRVTYRFSAADATNSSPVFMTVQGREPTASDIAVRTRQDASV